MPALPTVLARSAGGVVGVPDVQVATPAIASALAKASGDLERLHAEYEKQAEQDGRLWAAKRSVELRSGLQRALQERTLSGEPVDGLGDWAATAADEAFREAAKDAPNKFALSYLELSGADARGDLLLSGDKAEADYKITQRVTQAEDALNSFTSTAALGGYAEAERLAGEWKATIDGLDGLPLETRAKMQRGTRDILEAAIRGQLEKNPSAAIGKVQEYMSQGLIDANDGAALINMGQNEIDRQQAKAEANAARADRLAAKELALRQDDTAKTGYEMIAAGSIDPAWVIANRDNLSPSDYRIMLGSLNDPTDQRSTVAEGYRRIYLEGEDARDWVISELEDGRLSASTAKSLLDENQGQLDGSLAAPPVKVARDYLRNQFEAYKGTLGSDGYIASAAFADAQMNFENWLRDNPEATPVEIQSQAELEARRAGADLATKAMSSTERPAFLVGTKDAPDIRATRIATVDAFLKRLGGDLTAVENDPEFQKEIARIEKLEAALNAKSMTGAPR